MRSRNDTVVGTAAITDTQSSHQSPALDARRHITLRVTAVIHNEYVEIAAPSSLPVRTSPSPACAALASIVAEVNHSSSICDGVAGSSKGAKDMLTLKE